MPPTSKPFPRFIADTSQERRPHGRWEERLVEALADRCAALADEAGAPLDEENVRWFPERTWGDRAYIPATSRTAGPDGGAIEYFGYVSYVNHEGGEPTDLRASADFTDVTVEDNPDWKIDLNDEVIGAWRARRRPRRRRHPDLGRPAGPRRLRRDRRARGRGPRPDRDRGGPLHPDRGRRRRGLRRRPLPEGPPLGPAPAPGRRGEPLRRARGPRAGARGTRREASREARRDLDSAAGPR